MTTPTTTISFSTIWQQLIDFARNPRLNPLPDTFLAAPFKVFPYLLAIDFLLMIPTMGIISFTGVEEEQHEIMKMLDNPAVLFLFAVIIAPVVEELFFRFPIGAWWEKLGFNSEESAIANWWQRNFKAIFWFFTLFFAAVHFSNFASSVPLYLAPILVLPQLILGIVLGFIRVGWSTRYSILFHAIHNAIPVGLLLLGGDSLS